MLAAVSEVRPAVLDRTVSWARLVRDCRIGSLELPLLRPARKGPRERRLAATAELHLAHHCLAAGGQETFHRRLGNAGSEQRHSEQRTNQGDYPDPGSYRPRGPTLLVLQVEHLIRLSHFLPLARREAGLG